MYILVDYGNQNEILTQFFGIGVWKSYMCIQYIPGVLQLPFDLSLGYQLDLVLYTPVLLSI